MSALKCNTDIIRGQVAPALESCCSQLSNASSTVSGLPSLEGCEGIGSIAGKIDAVKSKVSEAKASVLEAADYAEQKEKENLGIIDWLGSLGSWFGKVFNRTEEDSSNSNNEEATNASTPKFGTLFELQNELFPGENNLHDTIMTNNMIEILAAKYGVETTTEKTITLGTRENISEIPLYNQLDYGTTPYGYDGTSTIRSSGCGIASYAMVLSYLLDREILPSDLVVSNEEVDDFHKNYNKYRVTGGSAHSLFTDTADDWGVTVENYYWGEAWGEGKLMEALANGQPVIFNAHADSVFTEGGHFIVLTGLTEDGKIMVNDPNGANYMSGNKFLKDGFENGFDPEYFSGLSGNYFVYNAKDTSNMTTETETTTTRKPISVILNEINQNAAETPEAELIASLVKDLSDKTLGITNNNQNINNTNLSNNNTANNYFNKDITFDVQYNQLGGYIKGYSLGLPSTINTENAPKNIIVYLHGLGDATLGADAFNKIGIQGAISNSELAKPNAIVVTPQLSRSTGSPWCGPVPEKELANLLDNILSEYNLNREDVNITIMGNSSGGQGAVWMANRNESYFDKVVVMDGANSLVQPSDVNQPMIGYASTQSGGNHYKYMTNNLASSIGEENVFIVESEHNQLQNNAYNIDANNNGISDMLEFAFSFDSQMTESVNQNTEEIKDENLKEDADLNKQNAFGTLFDLFPQYNTLSNYLMSQRILESLAEKYDVQTENGTTKRPTSVILNEIKAKVDGTSEESLVAVLEQWVKQKPNINYISNIINIQPKNNSDIAHRGYTPGGIYDNSAEGFRLAGEKGFWGCEADVRFDSNGNLVCSHNTVKNGENPTSFEEYLDICKEYGMTAIIDLKYEEGVGRHDGNLSPAILKAIQEKGMLDSCILQTNNYVDIPYIRENSEDARIWYLTDVISDKNLQLIEENNVECVNILSSEYNARRINKLTENGIDVCVWNVQTETSKERLLNMGAKYIMSDNVLGITPYQEGEEDFNGINNNLKSNLYNSNESSEKELNEEESLSNTGNYNGEILIAPNGKVEYDTVNGQHVKETWCPYNSYNGNSQLDNIIANLKKYEGEKIVGGEYIGDLQYWVRDDGVQMLGNYVMVAADVKSRENPWTGNLYYEGGTCEYGDIVETTLGTGIIVDYCEDAANCREKYGEDYIRYDIYTAWWEEPFRSMVYADNYIPPNYSSNKLNSLVGNTQTTPTANTQNNNTQADATVNTQNNNSSTSTNVGINSNPDIVDGLGTEDARDEHINQENSNINKPSSNTEEKEPIKPNSPSGNTGNSNNRPVQPITPNKPENVEIPKIEGILESVLEAAQNAAETTSHSEYICDILHKSGYLTEEEMNLYKKYNVNEICERFEKIGWEKIVNAEELEVGDIIIINKGEEETIQIYAGDNKWYTIDDKEAQEMKENWAENTTWYAYRPTK